MNAGSTVAGDRRRLAVCLFVAWALHAVVLLNVDLPEARLPDPAPALEVVLRQQPAVAPRQEDAGVGMTVTNHASVPHDDEAAPERAAAPRAVEPFPPPSETEPVAETLDAPKKAPRPSVLSETRTHDLARAIAAQAEAAAPHLDAAEPGESPPRVRRLTGPPSGDPELAYYLESWRRKVERVGNINYPSEARARGLSGTLRLLVVIDRDGVLKDARLLESSGHELLDEGAVRIVNLAAPFSPFTKSMRTRIDLLEIERRWRFRKDRLTPMP